jgi:hypothetical protein
VRPRFDADKALAARPAPTYPIPMRTVNGLPRDTCKDFTDT